MRARLLSVSLLMIACSVHPAHADGPDHAEVQIGQSASGRLKAGVAFTLPVQTPRSIFPGFPGWADSLPGFASVFLSEPDHDLFPPDPLANLEILVTAIDDDLHLLNDQGTGFVSVGDTLLFGPPHFDFHPLWNLPHAHPGEVFSITLVLRDRAGILSDSEPFTLSLTPAPCVGDFNDDGEVNTPDLVYLLNFFGRSIPHGQPGHDADINHDGLVDTTDLVLLLSGFGGHC